MHCTRRDYTQEPHSCMSQDESPRLTLELMDAGAGEYLVVTAHQWAIDAGADFDLMVAELRAMLATARKD